MTRDTDCRLSFCFTLFFLTLCFLNLRIVVWIIVKVFWFSEGTPPWGMSKLGSLSFCFFFLSQLQSTLLKNIDHTAQKAVSFGSDCQSRRVQRSLRKDCHAASSWPLLALGWSKNRPDILFRALSAHAMTWWWYSPSVFSLLLFVLPLFSFIKMESHFFLNLSSFQPVPASLLVF